MYGRTLQAFIDFMAKCDRNLDEFALHQLRIGGATTFAAGEDISGRVMQIEGKWKPHWYKEYSRNNVQHSRRVSRKLVVTSEEKERQPGKGTAGGRKL